MKNLFLIAMLVLVCVTFGFGLAGGFKTAVEAQKAQQQKETLTQFLDLNDNLNHLFHRD